MRWTNLSPNVVETLVDIASSEDEPDEKVLLSALTEQVSGNVDAVMEALKSEGLVDVRAFFRTVKSLMDRMLTFLETREAQQMEYGMYDIVHTGTDLLTTFLAREVDANPGVLACEVALRRLVADGQVIRLRQDERTNPETMPMCDWLLRSRIAELVRTVRELRQRFPEHRNHTQSLPLVRDVKFEVRPREVPKRNIPLDRFMARIGEGRQGQEKDNRKALNLLGKVLLTDEKTHWAAFQERACRRILSSLERTNSNSSGEATVVCAGTGSGKTLAYFVPALYHVIRERVVRGVPGCKVIAVYPRVALAEKQLEEFISLIYHLNTQGGVPRDRRVSAAIDYGKTPWDWEHLRRSVERNSESDSESPWTAWPSPKHVLGYRFSASVCPACRGTLYLPAEFVGTSKESVAPHLRCGNEDCPTNKPDGVPLDFIRIAKSDIADDPPDVLVISTESLNDRLMSPRHQSIFGTQRFCAPALVMVDEIHLHTGLAGAQVAHVLRRLRRRLSFGPEEKPPHFVGLSATIANPESFFADLTGLPRHRVSLEQPDPDAGELEVKGAEYYLFVKPVSTGETAVLSSLIQTTMAVVHQVWRPKGEECRTFAFVNSLDILRRWSYQMRDAEGWKKERNVASGKALFELRLPSWAQTHPEAANYFFTQEPCAGCEAGPRLDCLLFRNGECWWTVTTGGLATSAKVDIVSSHGGEPKGELVIATASLEVGFDDPSVAAVIQYLSPTNLASFVQRKGRGGRRVGTRPLMVTILSPYRAIDVFNYQNHHRLVNPRFGKLPLSPSNPLVCRIHAFYALFDWLAARSTGRSDSAQLEAPWLTREMLDYAADVTADEGNMREFLGYLARCQGISRGDAYELLFAPEGVLQTLGRLLQYESPAQRFHMRQALPDYLPSKLFLDINLPTIRVWQDKIGDGRQLEELPVDLGMAEALPGNVTYRFSLGKSVQGGHWLPPTQLRRVGGTLAYSVANQHRATLMPPARATSIPSHLARVFPLLQRQERLEVLRVTDVALMPFSASGMSWGVDLDSGDVRHKNPGDRLQKITDRSTSYPLCFTEIVVNKDDWDPLPDRILRESALSGPAGVITTTRLVQGAPWMTVKRVTVGVEASISGGTRPQQVTIGFSHGDGNALVGLGFELDTEGIVFTLSGGSGLIPPLDSDIRAELAFQILQHRLLRFLSTECGATVFAAQDFLQGLWTHLAQTSSEQHGDGLHGFARLVSDATGWTDGGKDSSIIQSLLAVTPGLANRRVEAVNELLRKEDFRARFRVLLDEAEKVVAAHLPDMMLHSLKHALKRAATVSAGAESDRDISAWAALGWDYPRRGADIYLFENTHKGTGLMRALHRSILDNPRSFWREVEQVAGHCPVGDGEELLCQLVLLPTDQLRILETKMDDVESSRSDKERGEALERLSRWIAESFGLSLTPQLYRSIRRIFGRPLETSGASKDIRDWGLYREVELWRKGWRSAVGRWPSIAETTGLMSQEIIRSTGANSSFETWYQLVAELSHRREDVFACHLEAIKRQLRHPLFSRFLDGVEDERALYEWIEMDSDVRVARLVERFNGETGMAARFAAALFAPLGELNRALVYWRLNQQRKGFRQEGLTQTEVESIKEALVLGQLREAIERRVLATCVDACPECLDIGCEVETPQLGRLTLSRRLLRACLEYAKKPNVVQITPDDDPMEIGKALSERFRTGVSKAYLRFPLRAQTVASQAVAWLKEAGVSTQSGVRAAVELDGSDLVHLNLPGGLSLYEITLSMRGETGALD